MTRQVFRTYVRLALAVCALTTLSAQADVITDLFNTGVDASGTPLGASVADPHYTLISQPGTSYTATTVPGEYPIGPSTLSSTTMEVQQAFVSMTWWAHSPPYPHLRAWRCC